MGKPEKASQSIVEAVKASVLQSTSCAMYKMTALKLIQASDGFSRTVRAVVSNDRITSTSSFVDDYRREFRYLNAEIEDMGGFGKFRWHYEDDEDHILWYSHDGNTYWNSAEQEVGDLTGRGYHLNVRVLKTAEREPRAIAILDSDIAGDGIRPTKSCELSVALETVIRLQRLMPEMNVDFSVRGEREQTGVDDIIHFLLRTKEEHDLLKSEQ